jgi:hypothetical protein
MPRLASLCFIRVNAERERSPSPFGAATSGEKNYRRPLSFAIFPRGETGAITI